MGYPVVVVVLLSLPMMASSGGVASGRGSGQLQAALARGRGGAPQPAVQQLVDAIFKLGYLPRQGANSTAAEKHLAVRLIKARKAGSLSSAQEAALANLGEGGAEAQAAVGVH